MKCEMCGNNEGERYRRNTMYLEDSKNFAICCTKCQELDNEQLEEQWGEYYLMTTGYDAWGYGRKTK